MTLNWTGTARPCASGTRPFGVGMRCLARVPVLRYWPLLSTTSPWRLRACGRTSSDTSVGASLAASSALSRAASSRRRASVRSHAASFAWRRWCSASFSRRMDASASRIWSGASEGRFSKRCTWRCLVRVGISFQGTLRLYKWYPAGVSARTRASMSARHRSTAPRRDAIVRAGGDPRRRWVRWSAGRRGRSREDAVISLARAAVDI